ncbi:MAG: alpha/beta hydrolase [bacterium]|nr:alpha/beta hydrolase [bacterium]
MAQCSKAAYLETARATFRSNTEDVLKTVTVPALIVTGDRDDRILPANSEHIAREIPGAELAVIPHAGHLPQLDNPAAFEAALAAFLGRTSKVAAS